jgi:tagaturonate reductase
MHELPSLNRALQHQLPSNQYPERALQFGTGAFLRGFVGHFIEAANRQGKFKGRIVAVGSTGSGRDQTFNQQDGLYNLWVRGVQDSEPLNEFCLVSSFSRALAATQQWSDVLACARNPDLELIFSNTTEAGIALDERDALQDASPRSFPAKLTRVLWERAQHFEYAIGRGVVVLPCELIENNGARLKELVLALAEQWQLDTRFAKWLHACVPFCNTLVDRIVPGAPPKGELEAAWAELGYQDELLTVAEPYRLFAIEADDATAARLAFADADPAIIVTNDIAPYRLRKVRLLNGAHTIMVPLALLAGCATVAEAISDVKVGGFLRHVLFSELVPSVNAEGAAFFAHHVLERFGNPFIQHELIDITLQQTTKLRVRIVPAILDYAEANGSAPPSISFGFAAWLLYMRDAESERPDAHAEVLRKMWQSNADPQGLVRAVTSNSDLWGTNLSAIPGFVASVTESLELMLREGVTGALDQHVSAAVGAN